MKKDKASDKDIAGTYCTGKRTIEELVLHRPHRIQRICATSESVFSTHVMEQIDARKIPLDVLTKDEFINLDSALETVNHQWAFAFITPASSMGYEQLLDKALQKDYPLVVVLDQVQDPGNLGAVFRVSECAGVSGLIYTSRRSSGISPLVRKTAAGATEFVPYSEIMNLARVIKCAKEKGFWVYGASLSENSLMLYEAEIHQPSMIIMGSEHKGIRKQTESLCDQLIHIPQHGSLQSMNVAASTSVILFELQRRVRYAGIAR